MPFPDLKTIAVVIPAYCHKNGALFGIRTERLRPRHWVQTWTFRLSAAPAEREHYTDNKVDGTIDMAAEYPGCPYCGNMGWYVCPKCDRIICHDGSNTGQCPLCGCKISSFVEGDNWNLNGTEH